MWAKMNLWLDDNRDPKDPKIQNLFGSSGEEVWVKTVRQAIQQLTTGRVTHISLDHDLGANAGDGGEVADWIESAAYHGTLERLSWSIHSKNMVEVKNMTQAMMNADKFWDIREQGGKP
jgi:hypothetical protein